MVLFFLHLPAVFAQISGTGQDTILINNKEPILVTSPPEIELLNPKVKPDQVVEWDNSNINIVGKINPSGNKTLLSLNNIEVALDENGYFNIYHDLTPGMNSILLKAVTGNSQPNEISFNINYQPAPVEDAPLIEGKYYALIIGINNYIDPLVTDLDNPIKDAETFYNTITSRYTFKDADITLLKNATMAEIIYALDHFAKIVRPVDNFLIFYAGHGVWDTDTEIGFWLPSDARKDSKLAWFRNSTLRDYLREINSKHTLLISDACFGGSIFKTRAAFIEASTAIKKLYELPSRKAMTSGTLTEVPDRSAFLKYLIDRLENNTEQYLSSEQLFSSFRIAVINNSDVIPQYGEIRDVGDEGGDFIFILKDLK